MTETQLSEEVDWHKRKPQTYLDRYGGLKVVEGYTFGKDGDKMKKYYLAYGSNLNVRQMRFRCPTARIVGTAEIEDYELLFKGSRSGSYLTIEPKKGSKVPVAVWSVEEEDEISLDRYEGFPTFYYKKEMEIVVKGIKTGRERLKKAFVYIMHEERQLGIPSWHYVETCIEGYSTFGFDESLLMKAIRKSRRGLGI